MSSAAVLIGVASLFLLACGALAAAWPRGRLGVAAIALFVVACSIWVAAFAAIVSGYRDADGFVGCNENCSSVHHLSAIGFLAPPLLISLSAFGMIVAVGRRRQLRRRAIDENHA
ncbi:MAG TPA: hypothetical protein VLA69_06020 [Gaiellaceae bacterium]|nr:hypothetical protein [Gaiellaceae bacterium]